MPTLVKHFEPGLYRHYKGGLYFAKELVMHHEQQKPMVLYFSLETRKWDVRPLVGWEGDPDGWRDPAPTNPNRMRFELVTP